MSEFVRIDDADGVRRVRIDRPDKRNALTRPMMQALGDAFADAERDPSVRAILLDSVGPVFCAGADLDGLAGEPLTPDADPGHRFLMTLGRAEKPLVAAIQGPAVGIGATLLLHFDLLYAAPEALLRAPFVDLGLTPEGGATILLPGRIGHARAARFLMLCDAMSADQALAAGVITEVVPAGTLADHAEDAARRIAAKPPQALAATKRMLRPAGLSAAMDEEQLVFQERMRSDEFRAQIERAQRRMTTGEKA